ncbi:MAG: hypothetical protein R2854_00410 [Caldilineaceae bacterium]
MDAPTARYSLDRRRLDVNGVMGELARDDRTWTGMDAGSHGPCPSPGDECECGPAFYMDVLGFDHMIDYPSAGFLGAGGYHHPWASTARNGAGRGKRRRRRICAGCKSASAGRNSSGGGAGCRPRR